MTVERDWGQFEASVRDALLAVAREQLAADRASGAVRTGDYTADLHGTYPETEVVIRGPGVKSGQWHEWRFAIYDHWGFDPNSPDPDSLGGLMWTDMDD